MKANYNYLGHPIKMGVRLFVEFCLCKIYNFNFFVPIFISLMGSIYCCFVNLGSTFFHMDLSLSLGLIYYCSMILPFPLLPVKG